jgi:dTMP kinase
MSSYKRDYRGAFISLEGVDGSGKSSLIPLLEKRLRERYPNRELVLTREPGGTRVGEAIRKVLFDFHDDMEKSTELLLFLAARAALVREILTHLYKGKVVISDRYADSTFVYQGIFNDMDLREVFDLNSFATKNLHPDLTFALLIPYEESTRRLTGRPDNGKYDLLPEPEFRKIYEGYETIHRMFPNRVFLIDGTKPQEEIVNLMMEVITKHKIDALLRG